MIETVQWAVAALYRERLGNGYCYPDAWGVKGKPVPGPTILFYVGAPTLGPILDQGGSPLLPLRSGLVGRVFSIAAQGAPPRKVHTAAEAQILAEACAAALGRVYRYAPDDPLRNWSYVASMVGGFEPVRWLGDGPAPPLKRCAGEMDPARFPGKVCPPRPDVPRISPEDQAARELAGSRGRLVR